MKGSFCPQWKIYLFIHKHCLFWQGYICAPNLELCTMILLYSLHTVSTLGFAMLCGSVYRISKQKSCGLVAENCAEQNWDWPKGIKKRRLRHNQRDGDSVRILWHCESVMLDPTDGRENAHLTMFGSLFFLYRGGSCGHSSLFTELHCAMGRALKVTTNKACAQPHNKYFLRNMADWSQRPELGLGWKNSLCPFR